MTAAFFFPSGDGGSAIVRFPPPVPPPLPFPLPAGRNQPAEISRLGDFVEPRCCQAQIMEQPVLDAIDPAVNGNLLSPRPGAADNGGAANIDHLLGDIEFAEQIQPGVFAQNLFQLPPMSGLVMMMVVVVPAVVIAVVTVVASAKTERNAAAIIWPIIAVGRPIIGFIVPIVRAAIVIRTNYNPLAIVIAMMIMVTMIRLCGNRKRQGSNRCDSPVS